MKLDRYQMESIVNAAFCICAGDILDEDMDERIMLAYITGMRDLRDSVQISLKNIEEHCGQDVQMTLKKIAEQFGQERSK